MVNKFVSNFSWILVEEIAVGSLPKQNSDLEFLKQEGIKCILTLCAKNEGEIAENISEYFYCKRFVLPDHSSKRIPTKDELTEALNILKDLITKGPVYIHCFAGVERSPLLCMAYLMTSNNIDRQTALEYMMQTHPNTNPLKGQLELLNIFTK